MSESKKFKLIDGKKIAAQVKDEIKLEVAAMIDADIDYLVLGCTHYRYLTPLLVELLPNHVKIIDSGEAVARQTKAVLEKHNLLNTQTKKGKYPEQHRAI